MIRHTRRSNRQDPLLHTVRAVLARALQTIGDLGDPQRPHRPPCNCAQVLQELQENILEAIRDAQQIFDSPDNTSVISEERVPCPYADASTSPPSSSTSRSSSPTTPQYTSVSAAARSESIRKRRPKTTPVDSESDVAAKRRRKHQDLGSQAEDTEADVQTNDNPASDAATTLAPDNDLQDAPGATDNLPIDQPPTSDPFRRQNDPPVATSSELLSQLPETIEPLAIAWEVDTHGVAVLKPTASQLKDFDILLTYAGTSTDPHVRSKGVFKISLPPEHHKCQHVPPQYKRCRVYESHVYPRTDIFHIKNRDKRRKFGPERPDGGGVTTASPPSSSVEEEIRKQDDRLRDNSLKGLYYATDLLVEDEADRRARGFPAVSPIHPLAGDQLSKTTRAIEGIHSPNRYESDHKEGSPFLLHTEDFQLCSVNLLHQGRKIWICVFPDASNELEDKSRQAKPGGKSLSSCSQFIRHACICIPTAELEKWGIPYTAVDQRAGEIVVTLPSTYHQGFSLGYTKAEAVNYADKKWDPGNTRNPCGRSCSHDQSPAAEVQQRTGEQEDNTAEHQRHAYEKQQTVITQERIACQGEHFQRLYANSKSNLGDVQEVRVMELVLQCAWPEMPSNFIPEKGVSNIAKKIQSIREKLSFNTAQERVLLALLARAHHKLVQKIEAERLSVRKLNNRRDRNSRIVTRE
ncbi:unnamed protein product [Clonostachys rosea]|uniref:JmjC domain-containing protein n=1 Tax=Bionectria ochroleuca TaxID=29856 RepID=A0ABY6UY03_BIOOC|nr:unnamed protein product [Clonostachys rosea]